MTLNELSILIGSENKLKDKSSAWSIFVAILETLNNTQGKKDREI